MVTAQEVKNRDDDAVLIHVMDQNTFKQRRIPGAVNIPVDSIDELAPTILPDKEQKLIVYCASKQCTASPNAATKLRELGYTNVNDFDEGIVGWETAGFAFAR